MTETTELTLPRGNRLLATLPNEEYGRLLPKLEQIPLNYGESIYQRGEIIRYLYFPISGIISLLATIEESGTLEVAIIGKEGMVGLPIFLGVKTSNNLAVVQGAGMAMRVNAADFLTECQNGGALTRILQRFTHSRLTQVSQSAICYRLHLLETRLARWLLMIADRMESDEFQTTQELLSSMLGVRREAVNKSAVSLQQKQLISYSRGHLLILNREGLESVSCPCYAIIKDEEKSFPITRH